VDAAREEEQEVATAGLQGPQRGRYRLVLAQERAGSRLARLLIAVVLVVGVAREVLGDLLDGKAHALADEVGPALPHDPDRGDTPLDGGDGEGACVGHRLIARGRAAADALVRGAYRLGHDANGASHVGAGLGALEPEG